MLRVHGQQSCARTSPRGDAVQRVGRDQRAQWTMSVVLVAVLSLSAG